MDDDKELSKTADETSGGENEERPQLTDTSTPTISQPDENVEEPKDESGTEPEVVTDGAITAVHPRQPSDPDRLQQIRTANVENLKDLLSGSAINIQSMSNNSLISMHANSDQLNTVDGVPATSHESLDLSTHRADLNVITEEGRIYERDANRFSYSEPEPREVVISVQENLPGADNSQQVMFSEILYLEQICRGRTIEQPIDVLKFAADISLCECIRDMCVECSLSSDQLYLGASGMTYTNPSDNLLFHTTCQDACSQTQRLSPDLLNPSADLFESPTTKDSASQCETTPESDLEDLAQTDSRLQMSRGSRKSVTIIQTEAWLKNNTDMAISCYLPLAFNYAEESSDVKKQRPKLSQLINDTAQSVVMKIGLASYLHQMRVSRFQHHIQHILAERLTLLRKADGSVVPESELATWILSVGFLQTFCSLLSERIYEAIQAYKTHSPNLPAATILSAIQTTENLSLIVPFTVRLYGQYYSPPSTSTTPTSDKQSKNSPQRLSELASPILEEEDDSSLPGSELPSTSHSPSTYVADDDKKKGGSLGNRLRRVSLNGRHIPLSSVNWRKLKELTLNRKKSRAEMVRMKRMAFLDELMNELTSEEMSLLQAMFLAINKSKSAFVSVSELRDLFTEAFSRPFSEVIMKKIMMEIDLDKDGFLCLLDFFSVFYLAEIYFQALGDGFRDPILCDTAKSFTASHALTYIAVSELCFYNGFRLSMDTNVFVRQCEKSNIIRMRGDFGGLSLPDLDLTSCRMYCFSFLGLDNGFLESICDGINDICRLKMSPLWSDETRAKPRYDKSAKKYTFTDVVLEAFEKYKDKKSSYFKTLTELAKPSIPTMVYRPIKCSLPLEPPYVFGYQGKDSHIRMAASTKGFETRCKESPANQHSMNVLRDLDKKGGTLARVFLEKSLFHNWRMHNLIKTYCFNTMPMWPRPLPLPSCATHDSKGSTCSETAPKLPVIPPPQQPIPPRISKPSDVGSAFIKQSVLPPHLNPEHLINVPANFSGAAGETLHNFHRMTRASINSLCERYDVDNKQISWAHIHSARRERQYRDSEFVRWLKLSAVANSVEEWNDYKSNLTEIGNISSIYGAHITYLPQTLDETLIPPIPTQKGAQPRRKLSEEERRRLLPNDQLVHF